MARTETSPEDRPDQPDQPGPDPSSSETSLTLDFFGTLVTFQVRSVETEGAYAIFEMVVPPGRTAPQMHVHAAAETFQILEGEFEFRVSHDGPAKIFHAFPGDMAHIPPNVPHGFRNVSKSASSVQIVIAPGSMEGYFLELGTLTTNTRTQIKSPKPPDKKRLAEIGEKYGIEILDTD